MSKDDMLRQLRHTEGYNGCLCIQCMRSTRDNKHNLLRKARRKLRAAVNYITRRGGDSDE